MDNYDYKDIRNFYFENETGKRIDCQKVDGGLFLYNVSGLGYEENIEYERIGNTFVQTNKQLVQNTITGDLEFYNMSYDEYCNFVDFILTANSLRLIYVPKKSNRIEYYRDIDVCKIEKTEEDEYKTLTCPIDIKCKSLWYEENKVIYTTKSEEGEIVWDFEWDSKFSDYNVRSRECINKGHVEAPVEIVVNGPIVNLKILLLVEGELVQEVPIKTTIKKYEKILYGTRENNFYINKENTDGTLTSLFSLDYIDFENDNVIRIPKNRSCQLKLTAENEILSAEITILPQYITV